MQVNLNNILNGNETQINIGYDTGVHATGANIDVKVSDEYVIMQARNVSEDTVITRQKQEEKDPITLSRDNLKTLTEHVLPEDFSKYEELGITPEQDELGRVVTVSERIKIELATHCENYNGDLSGISMDDLKDVFGGSTAAYAAYKEISELRNIDENAKAYLLRNELQPTIENVYMAEHSGTTGITNKLSEDTWEELKPQVTQTVSKYGMEPTEEVVDEGRFLIEHGIELTAYNILSSLEMNCDIEGKSNEQWIADISQTIALGMNPEECSAIGMVPDKYMAQDIIDAIENGNEEQLRTVLESGRELTVLSLKNPPTAEEVKQKINDERLLASKKVMEEIRQKMTYEACIHMLKNGIKVQIMPFDELSAKLDEYQNENAQVFFDRISEDNTDLFNTTIDYMERMKSIPNVVLGKIVLGDVTDTVRDIVEAGTRIKERYAQAEKLYNAVGTEVRTDLGDSMKNAMESSYTLLDELGIENTEASRRAMRILGYNSMEITGENIIQVQALDEQISKLFRNMTPAATAHIIENNINPLDTDIVTLNKNLDILNEELGYAETENFSRYLWKLEKNKQIPEEERAAYIGIYKLIRQVEKGDRRAIGAVMASGEKMTLKNLYHALKNTAYQGSDITVDDSTGLTEQVLINKENLSEQLSYFENLYDGTIDRIWHYTTPDKVREIGADMYQETDVTKLAEQLDSDISDEEYGQMRIEEMENARLISEDGIQLLLNNNMTVSISNMLSVSYMMNSKSGIWGRISEEEEELLEPFDEMDLDNPEEEYDKAINKCNEILDNNVQNLDVRKFRRLNGAIRLMGQIADKHSYMVPVKLNGETVTMKVSLVKDSADKGKVTVDIYSGKTGRMSVEMRMKSDGIEATVLGETDEAVAKGIKALGKIKEEYGDINISSGVISHIGEGVFGNTLGEDVNIDTSELYHMAKTFVIGLKG